MSKILIVDDEPDIREVLSKRLGAAGYRVSTAPDGAEGLKQVSQDPPDLILLDVMMPNKDGFTMLKELKSNEATCKIPVIMVTAKGELNAIYQAENLTAIDYIIKPIVFEDLLKYVRRYT
jgi:DNA-binding response OmpR family regulator